MSTKHRVFVSILVSILLLIVVGLTIAIVLVANTINITNSMSVKYEATNVSCILEASAKLYADADDTEGEIIKLTDETTSFRKEIRPEDNESDAGNIAFGNIELTSTGMAIYQFKVTNTASEGGESLSFSFKFVSQEGIDNVSVKMGASIDSASEISVGETRAITINANQGVGYIYLIYSVENVRDDAGLNTSWEMKIAQVTE